MIVGISWDCWKTSTFNRDNNNIQRERMGRVMIYLEYVKQNSDKQKIGKFMGNREEIK